MNRRLLLCRRYRWGRGIGPGPAFLWIWILLFASLRGGAASQCENKQEMKSMLDEMRLQLICGAPDELSQQQCDQWTVPAAAVAGGVGLAGRNLGSRIGASATLSQFINCSEGGKTLPASVLMRSFVPEVWAGTLCRLTPSYSDTEKLVSDLRTELEIEKKKVEQVKDQVRVDLNQSLRDRYKSVFELVENPKASRLSPEALGRIPRVQLNQFRMAYQAESISNPRVYAREMDRVSREIYQKLWPGAAWIPKEGLSPEHVNEVMNLLDLEPTQMADRVSAAYEKLGRTGRGYQMVEGLRSSSIQWRRVDNELRNLNVIDGLLKSHVGHTPNGLDKIHTLISKISAPFDLGPYIDAHRGELDVVGKKLFANGIWAASSLRRLKTLYDRTPKAAKMLGGVFAVLDAPMVVAAEGTYEVGNAVCDSEAKKNPHFDISLSATGCHPFFSSEKLVGFLAQSDENALVMLSNGPQLCQAFRGAYESISVAHKYRAQCSPQNDGLSFISRNQGGLLNDASPRWNLASTSKQSIITKASSDGNDIDKLIFSNKDPMALGAEPRFFTSESGLDRDGRTEKQDQMKSDFAAMTSAFKTGRQCCELRLNDKMCEKLGLTFADPSESENLNSRQ